MNLDLTELNISTLVMRLERNQNDLIEMKSTLGSYICEPRSPFLYERYESLKQKLENLNTSNSEFLKSICEQQKSMNFYMERAKKQFQEFNLLRRGIEEYVSGIRCH